MKLLPLAAASFLVGLSVIAQADRPPPEHHRPPQEAFDACKAAKRGDACTVQHGDRTITGTCDAPPDATELACRPDGPPPPPPEAFAACKDKREQDACSFTLGERTLTGVCSKGPHGEAELGCKPQRPPA